MTDESRSGRIVVLLSVSLDGFIEGPGGDLSWTRVGHELHRHFNEVLAPMDAFLSGRVTHELMASFWPTADEDPDASPEVVAYARIWREKKKYVFSRTAEFTEWDTTVVRSVDPAWVRALTEQAGRDIALGGARLTQAFMALGLVDELRLYLNPVILGAGTPLFTEGAAPSTFALVETARFPGDVLLTRYVREGSPG